MARGPFVKLDNLAKRWNGQLGVEHVSLEIPKGSFVALLGPSGCGKSTTLRLLAGLEQADEGRILIDGQDVTRASPASRNLSMVFQSYALFPHLSVAENVVFGMKVRRVPRQERIEKLNRALGITGLEGLEKRKPGALSGGQRQRVALARAIVAGHPLCLMDEPLSNLDAKLRHSVRKDIKKLQTGLGITVIYVTHDQSEAMSMADIVVLMKDGHIQQAGPPEDLYERPVNVFCAEFIGSPPMALVEGEALKEAPPGSTIGVRPEAIQIVESGKGDLACEIEACEYLGAETFIALQHPRATGLTVRLAGLHRLAKGQAVDIALPSQARHVFDDQGIRQIT